MQWRTLVATCNGASQYADDICRAVLTGWDEPHRRYHNITHLRDVLCCVDELAAHASDANAVRFAAWYHDIVYRGQPNDEHNSARRAEHDMSALRLPPALIGEVARLIRLTAHHDPAPDDYNGETLCDADLAILAAPPDRYANYTNAIRAEYAHLSDDAFREGRSKILHALLEAPALYRTPTAHASWTAQAHTNLHTELHHLTGSTTAPASGASNSQ
ncbi:metal-dependent phosphohydrolase (plasmid) [Mycobacterium paragordonae]|nr:metal-dependent phosphohydrolase [Mycobacterium paragordonae]